MSEERSDELYGALGVLNVDIVKRQLEQAAREVEALQAELDKIDIAVSDEGFSDTSAVLADIKEETPEPLDIVPEITVVDGDTEEEVHETRSTKFREDLAQVDPTTDVLIDPVLMKPFEPRTLKKEDIDVGFDPSRPELGEIIGMTEALQERIKTFFYDRGFNEEIVFFLTPEEFINLAAPLKMNKYVQQKVDKLRESIFPGGKDTFDFQPTDLYINIGEMRTTAHEGRHRSLAVFQEQEETGRRIKIPVNIVFQRTTEHVQYGKVSTRARPDEIPDVPSMVGDIDQEVDKMQYYYSAIAERYPEEIPKPRLAEGMSLEEYGELTKAYHEKMEELNKRVKREIEEEKRAEREYLQQQADKLDDVTQSIYEKAYDFEGDVDIPRDVSLTDAIFEITNITEDEIEEVSPGVFKVSKYMTYDTNKNELRFSEDIGHQITPELLRHIISRDPREGKEDPDIDIIIPDIDMDTVTREGEGYYELSVQEELDLIEDSEEEQFPEGLDIDERLELIKMRARQRDAEESDDEYYGNVSADGEEFDVDDILNDELGDV